MDTLAWLHALRMNNRQTCDIVAERRLLFREFDWDRIVPLKAICSTFAYMYVEQGTDASLLEAMCIVDNIHLMNNG